MTVHTFVTNNQGVKQIVSVEITPGYKQLHGVSNWRQLVGVEITDMTVHPFVTNKLPSV